MIDTITFLTDFGLGDDFAGVCRGVMKRIARDATILDVTHGIPPQAVLQGALVHARSVPYFPIGVHLAVVDPGVGSDRRAVAIRAADGRIHVGPDNGLLTIAADRAGIDAVRALTNARFHLAEVSSTFHARDLFAPVAAHLAAGVHFDDLGEPVDPATLVRVEVPTVVISDRGLQAQVITADRFGNLELNVTDGDMAAVGLGAGDRAELRLSGARHDAVVARTFADAGPGELIVYRSSYGAYTIAISGGSALAATGAKAGEQVVILPTA